MTTKNDRAASGFSGSSASPSVPHARAVNAPRTRRALRFQSFFLSGAVLGACLSVQPAHAADSATAGKKLDGARQAVLDRLHDGQFEQAERLARAIESQGDAEAGAFFYAFVSYWRLIYDDKNEALQAELGERLDRVMALGKKGALAQPSDESALWQGSAHLLRAQLRALQKKVMAAGFDAKKAHRLLRDAVENGTKQAESDFGLGTYEYFASTMPGIVRVLRRMLAIPGGNREQGLARLESAAERSHYFALESRLVLQRIYASDEERLYDLALEQARRTREDHPDTIAPLHAAARLELSLGRPTRALELFDAALARAAALEGVAPSVTSVLRYWAAAAELERFRPDRALDYLEPLIRSPRSVPRGLMEKVDRLAGVAIELVPEAPAWAREIERDPFAHTVGEQERAKLARAAVALAGAREALELERQGSLERASQMLEEWAATRPQDPLAALLAGRAQLLAGRAGATENLDRAAKSPSVPEAWVGTSRLLAGWAHDAGRDREPALGWYRAAEQIRFTSRDGARLCLTRVCTRDDFDPRGRPARAPGTPG